MPEIDKRMIAVALVILIIGLLGGMKYEAFKVNKDKQKQSILASTNATVTNQAPSPKSREIKIYLTGAVKKPGVYSLLEGDRVYQAVELAGGLLAEADVKNVNLAAVLQDGKNYLIPIVGEVANTGGGLTGTSGVASDSGRININSASVQELEKLPGVGPALAERIADYRELNGPFENIEDLKNVSGIGEKKFEGLKETIVVN